ncbi:MAG: choice-of-anchor Q domain-containing protein [Myxococcales bacterium]
MRRAALVGLALLAARAEAATLQVGPGQTYATPCAAVAAASAGDEIDVDAAGDYTGDCCSWSTDALTLRGVNGLAKIDNTGLATTVADQKGIFTIEPPAHSVTIEGFELAGASVSAAAGNNGAAIRHQVENLTVSGCYLHDNQDGILGAPPVNGTGDVLIEFSEFARNGAGDGYSHNMYLNQYATVTVQYCYSHEAKVGHLLKSRGWTNYILYNLLADLADGPTSYELDLPQGGLSYVIGNAIEQSQTGADQGNPTIVAYAEENRDNPVQQLFLVANTVVNDANKGTFLNVGGTPEVVEVDDLFHGPGALTGGSPSLTQSHDWTDAQGDPLLVNQAAYDYELQAGSPCIDAGVDPGTTDAGVALEPVAEYLAVARGTGRDDAHWDIGAFEYQDDGGPIDGGVALGDGGAGSSSGGTSNGGTSNGGSGSGGSSTGGGGSGGTGADGGNASAPGGCNCGAGSAELSLLGLLAAAALRRRRCTG